MAVNNLINYVDNVEKNLDLIKFAVEYKKIKTKELKNKFLRDNLQIRSYVPFLDKIHTCENLVRTTMQEIDDGVIKGFKANTPVQYIIYNLNIINIYTNLIIDFNNSSTTFDFLNETGLLGRILEMIPEKETREFAMVKDMVQEDFLANKWNIYNFADDTFTKGVVLLGTFVDGSLTKLNDLLESFDKEGFKEAITKGSGKLVGFLSKLEVLNKK